MLCDRTALSLIASSADGFLCGSSPSLLAFEGKGGRQGFLEPWRQCSYNRNTFSMLNWKWVMLKESCKGIWQRLSTFPRPCWSTAAIGGRILIVLSIQMTEQDCLGQSSGLITESRLSDYRRSSGGELLQSDFDWRSCIVDNHRLG